MNLFHTGVSQFELIYWNKLTFPRHSNLLRCTCVYVCVCVCICIYIYIYIYYIYIYIYNMQWCEKVFAPFLFFIFCLFVTLEWFRSSKKSILHKDNPSTYKMQFWNNDLIFIRKKKPSKPAWQYMKHVLPPKSNNWKCHPLQQQQAIKHLR